VNATEAFTNGTRLGADLQGGHAASDYLLRSDYRTKRSTREQYRTSRSAAFDCGCPISGSDSHRTGRVFFVVVAWKSVMFPSRTDDVCVV